MRDWPWSALDVEADSDERTLRRAYARLVKQGADQDPEAFQRLRAAYEMALQLARNKPPEVEATPALAVAAESETLAKQDGLLEPDAPLEPLEFDAPLKQDASSEPDAPPKSEPAPRKPGRRILGRVDSDLDLSFALNPKQEAQRLWDELVADAESLETEQRFKQFFDAVENLRARDELEWLALQYCANAATPPARRRVIAEALGWEADSAHLARRNPAFTTHVLELIFAPDPKQEARRLWDTLLSDDRSLERDQSIKQFFDAVESLATHDELEWLALQYCADAATPSARRLAIARALNWRWKENSAHLFKRNAVVAAQALRLIEADDLYQELNAKFPGPMRALEQPLPSEWSALRRMSLGHYPDMGRLLFELDGAAANVARFRLSVKALTFWRRVASRHVQVVKCRIAIPVVGLFGILLGESIAALRGVRSGGVWYDNAGMDASLAFIAWGALLIGEVGYPHLRHTQYPSYLARWRQVMHGNLIIRQGWVWLWLFASLCAFAMPLSREVSGFAGIGLALALAWAIILHGLPDGFGWFVRSCAFVVLSGLLVHQFVDNGGWYTALVFGALSGLAKQHGASAWAEQVWRSSYRLLWLSLWLSAAFLVAFFLTKAPIGEAQSVADFAWSLPQDVRVVVESLGVDRVLGFCWAIYAWLCVTGAALGNGHGFRQFKAFQLLLPYLLMVPLGVLGTFGLSAAVIMVLCSLAWSMLCAYVDSQAKR